MDIKLKFHTPGVKASASIVNGQAKTISASAQGVAGYDQRSWQRNQFMLEDLFLGARPWVGFCKKDFHQGARVLAQKERLPLAESKSFLFFARNFFNKNDPIKGFAFISLAEKGLNALHKEQPDDPQINISLTETLLLHGNMLYLYQEYQEALGYYSRLIEEPMTDSIDRAWGYYYRGTCQQMLGELGSAKADLSLAADQAREFNLRNLPILSQYRLLELNADNEMPAEAFVADMLQNSDILPMGKALVTLQQARLLSKLGRHEEAIALILKIARQARSFSDKYSMQWISTFITSFTSLGNKDLENVDQIIEGLNLIINHKEHLPAGIVSFALGVKGHLFLLQGNIRGSVDCLRRAKQYDLKVESGNRTSINRALAKALEILTAHSKDPAQDQALLLELLDCFEVLLNVQDKNEIDEYQGLYYKRAQVLIRLKRFEQSLADLNYIIDNDLSDKNKALLDRGTVYIVLGNEGQALRDFSSLIDSAQDIPAIKLRAYYNRGSLNLANREFDQAYADLSRATEYDRSQCPASLRKINLLYLSVVLFAKKDIEAAYKLWLELGKPKESENSLFESDELVQSMPVFDELFSNYYSAMLKMDEDKNDNGEKAQIMTRMEAVKSNLQELIGIAETRYLRPSTIEFLYRLRERLSALYESWPTVKINEAFLNELGLIENNTETQLSKILG